MRKVDVVKNTPCRGEVALFARYLGQASIYAVLLDSFGNLAERAEGATGLGSLETEFFYDGTSRHLAHFDQSLSSAKDY